MTCRLLTRAKFHSILFEGRHSMQQEFDLYQFVMLNLLTNSLVEQESNISRLRNTKHYYTASPRIEML